LNLIRQLVYCTGICFIPASIKIALSCYQFFKNNAFIAVSNRFEADEVIELIERVNISWENQSQVKILMTDSVDEESIRKLIMHGLSDNLRFYTIMIHKNDGFTGKITLSSHNELMKIVIEISLGE